VTSTRFPKWTKVIISRLVVIPGCKVTDAANKDAVAMCVNNVNQTSERK